MFLDANLKQCSADAESFPVTLESRAARFLIK